MSLHTIKTIHTIVSCNQGRSYVMDPLSTSTALLRLLASSQRFNNDPYLILANLPGANPTRPHQAYARTVMPAS